MKANIFLILLLPGLCNFKSKDVSAYKVSSIFTADSLPNKILIINSFDAKSVKVRNGKRELFRELSDSLKIYLAKTIISKTDYEPILIPGILSNDDNLDSLIFSLIKQNNARKAILIRSLEVYFVETGVQETTSYEGKKEDITSYNLCAKNEYTVYDKNKSAEKSKNQNCNFFTKRTTGAEGHFQLRIGPGVVGKKKHTFGVVEDNAEKYIVEIFMESDDH